jgi:flavin-dependent thymidylate synthase
MQVDLAGYNIDSSLIRKLATETATPEVISAAYARISRSPKSVTELRQSALTELAKARRSNQNIIFELGHASVAEHAVFNFDIIGISRLLTETVETVRLASFTEKSQRYVTFNRNYLVPAELDAPGLELLKKDYIQMMENLFEEYRVCCDALVKLHASENPQLSRTDCECRAKEDARYILPLSTLTQLGMTINARSLENLLQRLSATPLKEAGELHAMLLEPVEAICPSLVKYTGKDTYHGSLSNLPDLIPRPQAASREPITLIDHTACADDRILSAMLYSLGKGSYADCKAMLDSLAEEKKQELWRQVFDGVKPWSKMNRAFELAEFTFELMMSESCWAQFKRHRMATMLRQCSGVGSAFIIPDVIRQIGRQAQWEGLLDKAQALGARLGAVSPPTAAYARLNASEVRVLVKMNLRELYHFVRLRSDAHAQWEIRELSHGITEKIRAVAPRSTSWLCGKSEMPA